MQFARICARNMAKMIHCTRRNWRNVLSSILVFTLIRDIYFVASVTCLSRSSIIKQPNFHRRKSSTCDRNGRLWKDFCRIASICAAMSWRLPICVALHRWHRSMNLLPLTRRNIPNSRNGLNACRSCRTTRKRMVLVPEPCKRRPDKRARQMRKPHKDNDSWIDLETWINFTYLILPSWAVNNAYTEPWTINRNRYRLGHPKFIFDEMKIESE